jgi:dTDP-D-glucose 4,6-dehydratase
LAGIWNEHHVRRDPCDPRRRPRHSRSALSSGLTATDDRLGQDSRYWLDSSRIKADLGWEPQIGWDEGLAEMVGWGRRYLDEIRDWPTDYVLRA